MSLGKGEGRKLIPIVSHEFRESLVRQFPNDVAAIDKYMADVKVRQKERSLFYFLSTCSRLYCCGEAAGLDTCFPPV